MVEENPRRRMRDRIRRFRLPNGDWIWAAYSHPTARRPKVTAQRMDVLFCRLKERWLDRQARWRCQDLFRQQKDS